jgi:hypothetical protein
MKDWCTGFPDTWRGVYIGECCKHHDNNCGTSNFFKCLKRKLGVFHASYITLGGMLGCLIKYLKV